MKCIHVVGARPNFMKVEPVLSALNCKSDIDQKLVHTGQHYDKSMSKVFFEQLDIAEPDVNLEVGSGSQAVQTATIMIRLEEYLLEEVPDLVLVYGDVNSTIAAALVCSKIEIPIGHVEAGLRSFDRAMPEEINRIITDQVSDLLFTPSVDANENLAREGVLTNKIHLVGNVMIDTLVKMLPKAETLWVDFAKRYKLKSHSYGLITLHRPANVDDSDVLCMLTETLQEMATQLPMLFPIHPRTLNNMKNYGLEDKTGDVRLIEPVGYLEFLSLQKNAALVVTDSGGIQEESTFLGIPCITVRDNTERPITVSQGTNYLIGRDSKRLRSVFQEILSGKSKKGSIPVLWDGHASDRIAGVIIDFLKAKTKIKRRE